MRYWFSNSMMPLLTRKRSMNQRTSASCVSVTRAPSTAHSGVTWLVCSDGVETSTESCEISASSSSCTCLKEKRDCWEAKILVFTIDFFGIFLMPQETRVYARLAAGEYASLEGGAYATLEAQCTAGFSASILFWVMGLHFFQDNTFLSCNKELLTRFLTAEMEAGTWAAFPDNSQFLLAVSWRHCEPGKSWTCHFQLSKDSERAFKHNAWGVFCLKSVTSSHSGRSGKWGSQTLTRDERLFSARSSKQLGNLFLFELFFFLSSAKIE